MKQALSNALKNGQDPAMALLCLRATPIDHVSSSPVEILLGRRIQDNLPKRFNRKPDDDQHYQRLHERQEEQKRSFDQHVRPLPMVVPGQAVNVRNPLTSRWEAGKVSDVCRTGLLKSNSRKGNAFDETELITVSPRCPGSLKRRSAHQSRRVKKP